MGYINEKDINRGRACSVCSGAKVVAGINNIGKTHKWVGKFVKNKRDLDIYSCGSAHKIEIICPDCGYEYKQRINQLVKNNSYKCPRCSDGVSYPEKFMASVLEQLGVEYKTQYLPKWIKPKKYDFYIKNLKCIIETHGKQHYSSISNFSSCGGRSLEEEQQNDKYKKEIAVKNGIKHYIELDCRESNLEWIKNSILNSELDSLFDLSKVDWLKCAEFANKNIIKEVCDYWNNGIKSTNQISYIYGS